MRRLMKTLTVYVGIAFVLVATSARADDAVNNIAPLLKKHCFACHSGAEPKGDLRLDQLGSDLADKSTRETWESVQEQLRVGAMPPREKPQPGKDEIKQISSWIDEQIMLVERAKRATSGRVVLRRLNRVEYENTVRDLLGVQTPLRDLLPIDSSANGFDNVGEALHTSSFLLDRYLEAAEAALNQAISNRPKPPPLLQKRYNLQETHQVKNTTEKVFRKREDGSIVLFTSSLWQTVGVTHFYPQERGKYRFRICASAIQSPNAPVTFRVNSGGGGMGGAKAHLVSYFDVVEDQTRIIEFVDYMEPRTTITILPYGMTNAQTVNKVGADAWDGPGLVVDWVEVEGPLHETWPPESHRQIFGEMKQANFPIYNQRDRVEVISDEPLVDAERILRKFARRAYRRSVTAADLKPLLALVEAKLAEKQTFEQAIRVALAAVLISPDFLFFQEQPGQLNDFALASRLSYFLWSSLPDEELLAIAERGELKGKLGEQVERLLNHPKAAAFAENFTGQWLNLRDIDFTMPSHILYPDFDEMLKHSMVRETELFFQELLKHDLPLTNFVGSDFAMLNGRLAKHYGIPDVFGWEFRRVELPPDSHRGGVLTMASVLKVTANGTHTSPVVRGAFVLDRILGTPPPKPPENIAGLEPDIRGATTIRQQLAKHRQVDSCASCHVQIDPPGFALESFDVIGGYREFYRTSGNGKPVLIDGKRMPYLQGPAVDPADKLPDGREFQNIDELKQLLLTNKDQLTRALASRLVTYATGGAPEKVDAEALEVVVAKTREKNYGFRTLVKEIVGSELFQAK